MNELRHELARIDFYLRWYVSQLGAGGRPSRFRGAGLEFDKITRYELGEDPRWINWLATARSGGMRVVKNTFVEERQLQVLLAVDLSASMDFGTHRASKRRVAAELAAVVVHVARRTGDLVGFLGYASKVERSWPVSGRPQYRRLVPATILEATGVAGQANFAAVLGQLPRKRSLIFALSDFQEDLAALEPAVKVAARHHDLIPVVVQDPRERALPEGSGLIELRDLETGAQRSIWLNRRTRDAWAARWRQRDEHLRALFGRSGVEALHVSSSSDPVIEIARLFLRRRRLGRWGRG